MARKKIKLKKNGNGFYQKMVNPLEESHGRVKKLSEKMKNPTPALREFWPPNLKK